MAAAWLIEEPQFGGAGRRRENEMTEPGSRGGHSPSYGGDTSREWGAGARRSAPRGASDMQRVRSDGPGWGGEGGGGRTNPAGDDLLIALKRSVFDRLLRHRQLLGDKPLSDASNKPGGSGGQGTTWTRAGIIGFFKRATKRNTDEIVPNFEVVMGAQVWIPAPQQHAAFVSARLEH